MKIIMSLSGGLDSSTMLAHLLKERNEVVCCVGFDYGSKHNAYELPAARAIADHYKIPFYVLDLRTAFSLMKSDLLLSGGDIPEGHYNQSTMISTVVPSRNMTFLSILAGMAESMGASHIAIGIHQGDHTIYPDCRPEFFFAVDKAILLSSDGKVRLLAPFVGIDKTEIVRMGLSLNVPYHLTRTCYKDQPQPCGKCGSCVERAEAFALNAQADPVMEGITQWLHRR